MSKDDRLEKSHQLAAASHNKLLKAMKAINCLDDQQYAQVRVMIVMQHTKVDWEELMRS